MLSEGINFGQIGGAGAGAAVPQGVSSIKNGKNAPNNKAMQMAALPDLTKKLGYQM
jgi:hypothetical protein